MLNEKPRQENRRQKRHFDFEIKEKRPQALYTDGDVVSLSSCSFFCTMGMKKTDAIKLQKHLLFIFLLALNCCLSSSSLSVL